MNVTGKIYDTKRQMDSSNSSEVSSQSMDYMKKGF